MANISRFVSLAPISAISFDGRTVRFPRRKKRAGAAYTKVCLSAGISHFAAADYHPQTPSFSTSGVSLNILDTPVHQLMDALERAKEAYPAQVEQEEIDSAQRRAERGPLVKKTMWVDRYRPKAFVDLLGDEVSLILLMSASTQEH